MKHTAQSILNKKNKEKIVALTAYDYPFARILDESGVDIILVGDSLGMVFLGHENNLGVTVDNMIYHTKAVSRAVKNALVVGDMPFKSYENVEDALKTAKLFIEKGKADAVKIEGGEKIKNQAQALLDAGISVMGHVGMTPQSIEEKSGFRVQGKTEEDAKRILEEAVMLDEVGVFSIILECVPQKLALEITEKVKCPTIGIGAGPDTDGQVLVLHDMLGIKSNVKPRFVRQYMDMEASVKKAVEKYGSDIKNKMFPSEKESF